MTREQYKKEFFSVYSLISVLSKKNGCEVIKVRHKKFDKYIVLRSYPEQITAYEELYKIKSENLPLVYDVINLDDGQIILEEYIDGITISEVMESGNYNYSGAKKVILSVCQGLKILHEKKLVHRDIKPENVMIDINGRVVLIDFNASRKISVSKKDTVVMGTVGYASPEQLGVSQSDSRTDIYAIGVMLNVMMVGKHPCEKVANGKVGKIVLKCTSINPDMRYQTIDELISAL